MEATATEVKNKFGKFSDIARKEPVIVEKTGSAWNGRRCSSGRRIGIRIRR